MTEYILIGSLAGLVMGTVGVGGGAVTIFLLTFMAKFPQKIAQGTTLFIVAAPISLLAAMRYYKNGYVDVKAGLTIMASFLVASFAGAQIAAYLPGNVLKILLGVMLLFMGLKLIHAGCTAVG